jgi:hypothetical protein
MRKGFCQGIEVSVAGEAFPWFLCALALQEHAIPDGQHILLNGEVKIP